MKNFASSLYVAFVGSGAASAFVPASLPTGRQPTGRQDVSFLVRSAVDSGTEVVSSASQYSGMGASRVDLNRYNLPLEESSQEWTARIVAESSLTEEGIYLGAKSDKEIFVDTVKVEIPRRQNEGMGIELFELAGGRGDGLGITVVSGVVDGGCADGSGIVAGDSISKVAVKRSERSEEGVLSEIEEETSISTECLGYDATVDAICSLPPMESESESIVLTLKRLRRKPKVTLTLQFPPYQGEPDTTLELFSGENLRRAMLVRGVKLNDPLSKRFDSGGSGDCGADGTCATCVVNIVRGEELLNDIETQEKQILAKNPRWRLACKSIVGHGMQEGEMTVRVNPRQWD